MGDVRTVTPDRWSARGEAIATHPTDDRPLLIWGGIPGEESRVRVVYRGQHQVHGAWLRAPRPDPHRVGPPCERYDACGGCPLMHLDEVGQHAAHRQMVRDALNGAGLEDVALGEVHPSPVGLQDFRHVVKVGVGIGEHGRLKVGAWGRRSRDIVPIPKCPVAAPVLRKVMASLAHHVIDQHIEPYDPAAERGLLRAAVMRASRTSGEVLLTLVAGRRSKQLVELAEAVAQGCSEVVGVWLHLNSEPGNAIFVRDDSGAVGVLPIVGKEWIEERIQGVAYRIGPGDFFQTHPATAESLYRRTIERLDPGPDDAVVDLYCGVGGIALQAAGRAAFVVGVEEVDGAVLRAREAARLNRLTAEFHSGRVQDVLPELRRRLSDVRPLVVVNPARRGLEDGVIDEILAMRPARVVYISCNPMAMARDLRALRAGGALTVGEVELFEMFPNTPHVECLVTLDGDDAAPRGRAPRRKVVR